MSIKPSAHFLYGPDSGDWTGVVRRHEALGAKYDRCDTSKGTAYWWTKYQNDGYQVSVVNATKYDLEQPIAVGGGVAPPPPRELFFECGSDRIAHEATDTWTGRIVDQHRNVLYDLTQLAHAQWHMTRTWVRANHQLLNAVHRPGVTTFSPTSQGAVSLVLGNANQEVGMPATSPVERFLVPVTPLTDEEQREHQAMIERSKYTTLPTKEPRVAVIELEKNGAPNGKVFNQTTGENIAHRFDALPRFSATPLDDQRAWAAHAAALGYTVKFKRATRAEQLKAGADVELVEEAEPGYTLFNDADTAAAKAAEDDTMTRYHHTPRQPPTTEGDFVDEGGVKQGLHRTAALKAGGDAIVGDGVSFAPGGETFQTAVARIAGVPVPPEPTRRVWYSGVDHTLCNLKGVIFDLRVRAPALPAKVAEQIAAHLDALWYGEAFESALTCLGLAFPMPRPFEEEDTHELLLIVTKAYRAEVNVRLEGTKGKSMKELEAVLLRFVQDDFNALPESYKYVQPMQVAQIDVRYGAHSTEIEGGPVRVNVPSYKL